VAQGVAGARGYVHMYIRKAEDEKPIGGGDAALLGPGKNSSPDWVPGAEMPDWWGVEGASCGGCVAQKVEAEQITYVPVLCKRWSCDVCSFYRHAWLVRNLVAFVESCHFPVMWTLTLKTGTRTCAESFDDVTAAWDKLRKRLKRRYGAFRFVWVVETTQAGYAHLHVLVDGFLDHDVVRAAWRECTGDSDNVRFDAVRSKGVGSYIAKYVGKEVRQRRVNGVLVANRHLFGKSADVHFDSFTGEGDGWEVLSVSWRENAAWLRQNAVILLDSKWGPGRFVAKSVGATVFLQAWEGNGLLPMRERDGPVAAWDRDELPPIPVAERTISERTKRLVDRINAERRGLAMIEGAPVYDAERLARDERVYTGPNRSGFGIKGYWTGEGDEAVFHRSENA
jgi:hypothetical protein